MTIDYTYISFIHSGRWDYELYLRYDLYTNKHTQWFFFRVQNMRPGQTYRFTIVNLYKVRVDGSRQCSCYKGSCQKGMSWERGQREEANP